MAVGSRSLRHAFSLKRQTDIQTAVADGDIASQRGDIDYAPFGFEQIATVSDRGFFGKSVHGSFREVLHVANVLTGRERAASDLDLLHVGAFCLGGHASAQPDALLLPATWEHTLTWAVPAGAGAKQEMDYTSYLEQMGDASDPGYKEKFTGVWIGKFGLKGEFGDFVKISFEGGARERAASAATMPSGVTAASLFKINLCNLSFGSAGGEVNVDGLWASFELEWNSDPNRVLRSGQPVGEEEFIHRVDRGDQSLTGNIKFELEDVAVRQKFIDATEVGIVLDLVSADQIDSNPIHALLTIPHIQMAEGAHEQDARGAMFTITLDETSVLEKSGDPHFDIVITSGIDDTAIFTT